VPVAQDERMVPRLLLIATVLLALTAGAARGDGFVEKRCGDVSTAPDTAQDVRATNVTCRSAISLARRHMRTSRAGRRCDLRKASCTLRGYTCRRRFFGNSGTRVRCTKGIATVRFFYGV
jgi:hypothetical protein